MKAITTKYIGPTNFRGSRVKASDGDGNSYTMAWDAAYGAESNHRAAVQSLCAKMGWHGSLVGGETAKGQVWVWIGGQEPMVVKGTGQV